LIAGAILLSTGRSVDGQSLFEDAYSQAEATPIPVDASAVGTGFFISPTAILTSAHVLAGCRTVTIENRSMATFAVIREKDRSRDAAVLSTQQRSASFIFLSPQQSGGALQIVGYPATHPGRANPAHYNARSRPQSTSQVTVLAASVPAGMSGSPVVNASGQAVAVLTGRMNAGRRDTIASPVAYLPSSIKQYAANPAAGAVSNGLAGAIVKVKCQ